MIISSTWYLTDPDPEFWDRIKKQPLLFLHNLLDGLDHHVTERLRHAFDTTEEADDMFERSTWSSCARREITEAMHWIGSETMLENYYHLRAIVADLDRREIIHLIVEAERRAA
ncbi:hypothetical protein OpiT1DRAFT_04007 [Opitutaceae bacterium TAV1]|nr:hypothetical protein OpiT1DRAFT_04007 [Opitutaceae bacterium TAV1]